MQPKPSMPRNAFKGNRMASSEQTGQIYDVTNLWLSTVSALFCHFESIPTSGEPKKVRQTEWRPVVLQTEWLARCHAKAACQRWEIRFSQAIFVCLNFKKSSFSETPGRPVPHNFWMKLSARTEIFLQTIQIHLNRSTPLHQVNSCPPSKTKHDSKVRKSCNTYIRNWRKVVGIANYRYSWLLIY